MRTTPVEMYAYSPQKMHMHSCMHPYAKVQKLHCHGSYCKLILSLARASCRLSFAARPPAVSTKSVARRCLLKKPVQIHASSSALLQASSSLSLGRTRSMATELTHHRDQFPPFDFANFSFVTNSYLHHHLNRSIKIHQDYVCTFAFMCYCFVPQYVCVFGKHMACNSSVDL